MYSHSECLFNCRIKYFIRFCGCVPFSYPNLNNHTVCLLDDVPCLSRWATVWLNSNFYEELADNNDIVSSFSCFDCMKRCTFMRYTAHTSKSNFNAEAINKTSARDNFLYVHVHNA